MTVQTPPDVDPVRVAALQQALGAKRLGHLMQRLGLRLHSLADALAAYPHDAEHLMFLLHQTRGAVSSLGLPRLAAALDGIDPPASGQALLPLFGAAEAALRAITPGVGATDSQTPSPSRSAAPAPPRPPAWRVSG